MAVSENYVLVLETSLENEDGSTTDYSAAFDVVTQDTVNSDINVTEQPMVNGDLVSDHAYRSPYTQSIAGMFSLSGNKRGPFPDSRNRLMEIEAFFEDIQKQAALCNISLRSGTGDSIRFKARKDMVLKSISWTRLYNALSFSFTFQEVIRVNVLEAQFEEGSLEEGLPAITDPQVMDFTDDVLGSDEIIGTVVNILLKEGLVTDSWLNDFTGWTSNQNVEDTWRKIGGLVVGIGLTAVIAHAGVALGVGAIMAVFGTAAGVGAAVPGVGWVFAIGAVAAGAITCAIIKLWDWVSSWAGPKYTIEPFTESTDEERERFLAFLVSMKLEMDVLEEDISTYSCPTDEPQQCLVPIDDEYYVFTFTKNEPISENYRLTVTNIDEEEIAVAADISSAEDSIFDLKKETALFTTSGGKSVYILNNAHDADGNEATEGADKDLRSYVILVTSMDMPTLKETMGNIIRDCLMN